MPRPTLLVLTALAVLLHWLVLGMLDVGGGAAAQPQAAPLAFHTRMVAPTPASRAASLPSTAAPDAVVSAPTAVRPVPPPAQAAAPRRKARRPAPATPPDQAQAQAQMPPVQPAASDWPTPDELATVARSVALAQPPPEAAAAAVAPPATDWPGVEADGAVASLPQAAAPAVASASAGVVVADTAAAAAAPGEPGASAGVEIVAPGASGAKASGQPPPVRLAPSTRLVFEVNGQAKGFSYHAEAELTWRQDGSRYEAQQQVKAFLIGSRRQTSRGSLTEHGLQPERFGDKTRSERAAHFDFKNHQVTFSANAPPAAISDGAQDRLSVFLQLGALLAGAPERYPEKAQITLLTVGTKNADRWTFTVEGAETLSLPAGPTPALKLQRVPPEDRPYDQRAELWLGSALGYLPVRIRITQSNGDWADLRLLEHSAL